MYAFEDIPEINMLMIIVIINTTGKIIIIPLEARPAFCNHNAMCPAIAAPKFVQENQLITLSATIVITM